MLNSAIKHDRKGSIESEIILVQETNLLNRRIMSHDVNVKKASYMPEPVRWFMLTYIRTNIHLRNEWEIWKI